MEAYRVEGTYTQSGDHDRLRGELGFEDSIVKGHIDDIDQNLPEPQDAGLRNKVVEGEAYPAEGQLYFVKRPFRHALKNIEKDEEADDYFNPQEVHVMAETPQEGLEGEYSGIWTINRPGELPVEYLGTEDFELGWDIDPQQYETRDRSAEEVIQMLYDGELPEEPEDINAEQEVSRGTTNFRLERLEGREKARGNLPIADVNIALDGGVERERRVIR